MGRITSRTTHSEAWEDGNQNRGEVLTTLLIIELTHHPPCPLSSTHTDSGQHEILLVLPVERDGSQCPGHGFIGPQEGRNRISEVGPTRITVVDQITVHP